MSPPLSSNPFVGPRPIPLGEPIFGREAETRALYDLLQARRIVVLHSPSGAGKSSLVHAGMYPRLREARFDVWRPIRVNLDPRGAEGVAGANRYALSAMLSLEEELPPEHRRPVATLAGMSFADYLDSRPRRKNRTAMPIVLIFDQFEEVLTTAPRDVAGKRAFFEALGQALDGGRHWALFCIREDYLGALSPYRQYVPTQLSNTFRLDLLSLEGAAEAAERLAARGGRSFPGLDQLIHDLSAVKVQQADGSFLTERGLHVEPVYLQVVCRRLWDAMPPDADRIEAEDVTRYAEVSKALGSYYDESVTRVAAGNLALERAIRDWVGTRLIVGGIRSQVRQEAERTAGLDNGLIGDLLDSYVVRTEQRAGANWYELSHDRLVEPVTAANAAWEEDNLHALQVQARLWVDARRPEALLAGEAALRAGKAWIEANDALLTTDERDFVTQSWRLRRAEVRGRRRLMAVAVGFAILAMAATVSGAWAYRQKEEAEQATRRATAAEASAKADAGIAALRQLDALVATLRAQDATRLARAAEARTSEALQVAETRRREAERATWEASQARSRAVEATEDALESLTKARDSARRLAVSQLHGDSGRMAAFLVNYTDKSDGWWREEATWVIRHPGGVARQPGGDPKWRRLTFSPTDELLALTADGEKGGVWLWSFRGTAPMARLPGLAGTVRALAFSPDGRWLAAAAEHGRFAVWDVRAELAIQAVATPPVTVWDLAFDPGSAHLVGAGVDGTAYVWEPRDWASVSAFPVAPGRELWSVDATNERWLAASGDGVVHVFPWGGAQEVESSTAPGCRLHSLTDARFRPGTPEILMFGASPLLRRWRFETDQPCATITARSEIRLARYSPTGSRTLIVGRGVDAAIDLVKNDEPTKKWPVDTSLPDRSSALKGAVMAAFEPRSGGDSVLALAGADTLASVVVLDKLERPARSIPLSGHGAAVQEVTFSGVTGATGGTWLATADASGEVRVWPYAADGLHRSLLEDDSAHYKLDKGRIEAGPEGKVRVTFTPANRAGPADQPRTVEAPVPPNAYGPDAPDLPCPPVAVARERYKGEHITPITAVYCEPRRRYTATLSTDGTLRFWPNYSDEALTRHLDALVQQGCVEADLDKYLPDDREAWPAACGGSAVSVQAPERVASRPPDRTPAAVPASGVPTPDGDPQVDYPALREALLEVYTPREVEAGCGCQGAPRAGAWLAGFALLGVWARRGRPRRQP